MGEAGASARQGGRPLLLGHRGARVYAPENTPAAFELALQQGCDGFEFDVRLTADHRAVICHDPKSQRRTIAASTAGELGLPVLEDVLRRFAPRAFLDVELKVADLEAVVMEALQEAKPTKGYFVSSFLPEVVRAVHARSNAVPLGYICNDRKKLDEWRRLPIRYLAPHWRLVEPGLIEETHAAGVQVFVWTVNEAKAMKEFAGMGVDGLISDDTRLLAETLAR